jgi:hypothetical protein
MNYLITTALRNRTYNFERFRLVAASNENIT